MWSGQYLWGYLMTAIAVFLMPLVLLAHERGRDRRGPRAGALLVCWLQPWQGATLALIIARRSPRGGAARRPALARCSRPGAVALAGRSTTSLLGHFDPAWELAAKSNAAGAMPEWSWPWWAIVLTLAPLAVPAVLAYRLPAPSWQELAVRVWPFAALVVYLLPVGTFPYHAFQGLAIPLVDPRRPGRADGLAPPAPARVVALLA